MTATKEKKAELVAEFAKTLGCKEQFVGTRLRAQTDEIRKHPKRQRFRLLDDDSNAMAEGLYVGDDSDDLFGPLDDFGGPM